jgi:hypothetical protein
MSSGRQLNVFGATSAIAQDRVQKLSVLTSDKINVVNVLEMTGRGGEFINPALRKKPTQVYPIKAIIVVNRITKLDEGKPREDGKNRLQETYEFPLWTDEAPSDFNKRVAELFVKGDE